MQATCARRHDRSPTTTLLTKADANALREELDALAQFAERKYADERVSSRANRQSISRVQCREHEAFLSRLNMFRETLAGNPNAFASGQLYDFLSEWLIGALYED